MLVLSAISMSTSVSESTDELLDGQCIVMLILEIGVEVEYMLPPTPEISTSDLSTICFNRCVHGLVLPHGGVRAHAVL